MNLNLDADVAIVGCGPVGLTLGILLAQQGQRVTILERWPEPYPLPRAVHFDHEVGRILQSCGIGTELREIIEAGEIYEWRNATGTRLLRFGRIGAAPSGWPESSMFSQPDLERLLEQRAAELDCLEIRRGADVTSLEQHDDSVTLGLADGREVCASYVVGCDGANSTVRGLANIEVDDLGFFHDWLIVDIILNDDRVFDPINLQICDPARPTTAVSGGPGRRRWEFMRLPNETQDELATEETAWKLLAPWDVSPDNARLERHAIYTFGARHATQWRSGRVLIAGDAAHQMPPFAGQGMCAGIRDAANLFWKLGLVLEDHAPDSLLDTYTEERLPNARQAIQFSMDLGKVICVSDEAEAAARDEAMSAAVTDELSDVPPLPGIESGLVDHSEHAGKLFVQGTATNELGDQILMDERHGAGWRLLTLAEPSLSGDAAAWFTSIGGLILQVEPTDERSTRWLAEHSCAWALQRPDFRLYGIAKNSTDASQLVERLRMMIKGNSE